MDLNLHLSDEVVEALGPDPEREALEGVLLLLVREGWMSLERAGEILGFGDREEAARWYAERALPRLKPEAGDTFETEEPVFLENLTQEELDRLDRFLDISRPRRAAALRTSASTTTSTWPRTLPERRCPRGREIAVRYSSVDEDNRGTR